MNSRRFPAAWESNQNSLCKNAKYTLTTTTATKTLSIAIS